MEYAPDVSTRHKTISRLSMAATVLFAANLAYATIRYQSQSQSVNLGASSYFILSLLFLAIACTLALKPSVVDDGVIIISKKRIILSVVFGVIVVFWGLSARANRLERQEQLERDQAIMYGIYITAINPNGMRYEGKYGASNHYVILFDAQGREFASGYAGLDGKVAMSGVDGSYMFGHVVNPTMIYIDKQLNW